MQWQCRVAPSLGDGFAGTPAEVWGTSDYYDYGGLKKHLPTVFFGLYGLPDFFSLWRHPGHKAILWAGSDIKHFISGYWLDGDGKIKLEPEALAKWINENCESFVENGVEHQELMTFGIESKIVPSFLGNVADYPVNYYHNSRPQVYASVSGDNFSMYGWDLIEAIAGRCEVDFHLYGNTKEWNSKHSNVFVHGWVPKETMDKEIKDMQCGLRVLNHDGFSEILAKSVLWGQYPISRIGYPHIDSFTNDEELVKLLNNLQTKTGPNITAREYYLKNLNRYPWNKNV